MKSLIFLSIFLINLTTAPTTKAEFPGGMEALPTFIQENLEYPESAREQAIEGSAKVRLFLDEHGAVVSSSIVACDHEVFEQPVKDLIAKMPNWVPAQMDGKAVYSAATFKIYFQLGL